MVNSSEAKRVRILDFGPMFVGGDLAFSVYAGRIFAGYLRQISEPITPTVSRFPLLSPVLQRNSQRQRAGSDRSKFLDSRCNGRGALLRRRFRRAAHAKSASPFISTAADGRFCVIIEIDNLSSLGGEAGIARLSRIGTDTGPPANHICLTNALSCFSTSASTQSVSFYKRTGRGSAPPRIGINSQRQFELFLLERRCFGLS